MQGPFIPSMGIREFYKQFKKKTNTDWGDRHSMVPREGKYVWLERDFNDDDKEVQEEVKAKGKAKEDVKLPDVKAVPEIQVRPVFLNYLARYLNAFH